MDVASGSAGGHLSAVVEAPELARPKVHVGQKRRRSETSDTDALGDVKNTEFRAQSASVGSVPKTDSASHTVAAPLPHVDLLISTPLTLVTLLRNTRKTAAAGASRASDDVCGDEILVTLCNCLIHAGRDVHDAVCAHRHFG
jgi:hypothetical protein